MGGFAQWASERGLKGAGHRLEGGGYVIGHEADTLEAYEGEAAPGLEATVAHFGYTQKSGDDDVHQKVTVVVASVPESIGFAPYLSLEGELSHVRIVGGGELTEEFEPSGYTGKTVVRVRRKTSRIWLMQLFSPGLVDWLERSPDDLSIELAQGTLTVFRNAFIDDPRELDALCADAAHFAQALSEEALEHSVTTVGMDAPPPDKAANVVIEAAKIEGPVASVSEEVPAIQHLLTHSRGQWFGSALAGLFITLVLNVPGIVVPILLIGAGHWLWLGIVEGVVWIVAAVFFFRFTVASSSKVYAEEIFFRDYAKRNGLKLVAPLPFMAAHAAAKLPFEPERVLAGGLDGLPQGAIALKGRGNKRGDVIAVVAGPSGPIAQEPLETTGSGLTAEQLASSASRLAARLRSAAS